MLFFTFCDIFISKGGFMMIYERLKQLRQSRNLTQAELATQLNVSQGTIGNWESGKRTPDIEMVVRLAQYFNISTDYLLGKSDNMNFSNNIKGNKNIIQQGEIYCNNNHVISNENPNTIHSLSDDLLSVFRRLDNDNQCKLICYAYELLTSSSFLEKK